MALLIIILAIVSAFAMGLATVNIWRLTMEIHTPGIGRIVFWALFSMKVWTMFVLIYFISSSLAPYYFGGPDVNHPVRQTIRFVLATYLIIHPVAVNLAIYSWQHPTSLIGRLYRSRNKK